MPKNFLIALSVSLLFFLFVSFLFRGPGKNKEIAQAPEACTYSDLSGNFNDFDRIAFIEGRELNVPEIAYADIGTTVLSASTNERWVEVDLSDQKLFAWEGDKLFLETAVSTGLPWFPTPQGEFRIWIKLRATKMEGGRGKYYYYLPNVPYVMYFQNDKVPGSRGYGLHGAYWHNDFGTPRSHGCVNLPVEIAGQLYSWVNPVLPAGKSAVRSSDTNPGTKVIIHE